MLRVPYLIAGERSVGDMAVFGYTVVDKSGVALPTAQRCALGRRRKKWDVLLWGGAWTVQELSCSDTIRSGVNWAVLRRGHE
jgi:hypothetical protein